MSSASREFLMMREEEETGQLYVPALPKKEIKEKAEKDADKILEGEYIKIDDVLIDATRVNEYLTTLIKKVRSGIKPDETREKIKGVEISFKNGPSRLNYKEDTTWQELKEQLDERQELLKVAEKSKDPIYDADGAEVPKVSRSGGGEVINLKY